MLSTLVVLFYLKLFFHQPPVPPSTIPIVYKQRSIAYQCSDENGSISVCNKGCNRFKPPRAHHCSVCSSDRLAWDHHCHFVGNCITMETRKLFFAFLLCATSLVCVSALPVAPTLWGHARTALYASINDPHIRDIWWDRTYSWILVGGPVGRWPAGIALGFWSLAAHRDPSLPKAPGYMIKEPNLTAFLVAHIAFALALFTSVFLFHTLSGGTAYIDTRAGTASIRYQ